MLSCAAHGKLAIWGRPAPVEHTEADGSVVQLAPTNTLIATDGFGLPSRRVYHVVAPIQFSDAAYRALFGSAMDRLAQVFDFFFCFQYLCVKQDVFYLLCRAALYPPTDHVRPSQPPPPSRPFSLLPWQEGLTTIAFPAIGASFGRPVARLALDAIRHGLARHPSIERVVVVVFEKSICEEYAQVWRCGGRMMGG